VRSNVNLLAPIRCQRIDSVGCVHCCLSCRHQQVAWARAPIVWALVEGTWPSHQPVARWRRRRRMPAAQNL